MEQWYIVNADGFVVDVVLPDNVPNLEHGQIIVKYPWLDGMYKPKWNGTVWVEGLTAQEIQDRLNRPIEKTGEVIKQEQVDINLSALEVRTQGMQLIDDFTLGSLMTTDDRTAGMQLIDDYSLELIFALQATIETLTARITTLEGGV